MNAWAVFLSVLLLVGMTSSCSAKYSFAAQDTGKPTLNASAQTTEKTYFDESMPEAPEHEYNGIVDKGYILENLRESEYGWNIFSVCSALGIQTGIQEDAHNIYKNWEIPVDFYIEKDGVRLSFQGDVDSLDEFNLQNPYMAALYYKVKKNGKEIALKNPPVNYRAGGPCMDIRDLLDILDIRYFADGDTVYLDSEAPTPILGKVLYNAVLQLDSKEQLELALIYHYKGDNNPKYKSVELVAKGQRNAAIRLFDETNQGSGEYYDSGSVEYVDYHGENFIQVNLGKDTMIYKYEGGELTPVLTRDAYRSYLDGGLSLETDEKGQCRFVDKVNGAVKEIDYKADKTNAIYKVGISYFDRMEHDVNTDKLRMIANIGAVSGGRYFFTAELEFVYDGAAFTPVRMRSIDWARFGEDKKNGKPIESMGKYQWFDYKIDQ